MTRFVNRAYMRTLTTGTGTITLDSALPGYRTFADAGVLNGEIVNYVLEEGTTWEIGFGTYSSSGPTLSRTVTASSNSGAAVTLTGGARVHVSHTMDTWYAPDVSASLVTGLSEQYVAPRLATAAGGNMTPSADTIYFVPLNLNSRATFSRIGANISVVISPITMYLGLYEARNIGGTVSFFPGRLLGGGSALSVTSAVNYEDVISATLNPGLYFLGMTASANSVTLKAQAFGSTIPWAGRQSTPTYAIQFYERARTFAAPDDETASVASYTVNTTGNPLLMYLRT